MARKRKRSTGKKKVITAKQKSARRKNIAVARGKKKKSSGKKFKMVRGARTAESTATITPAKMKGREGHLKSILKSGGHHASVAGALQKGFASGRIKRARVGNYGKLVVQTTGKGGGAYHFKGQGQQRGVAKAISNL
jgi:hypothetical protein